MARIPLGIESTLRKLGATPPIRGHAVQIGLVTARDMLKTADRSMVMGNIRVLEKRGSKSGDWVIS